MEKVSPARAAGRLKDFAPIIPEFDPLGAADSLREAARALREAQREDAALARRLAADDRPLDPLGWDAWVWLRALFRHSDLPSNVVLVLVQGQLLLVHGATMPWPRLRNLAERVAALLEAGEGRAA